MDIKEIRETKEKVEQDILSILQKFEENTKLPINDVTVSKIQKLDGTTNIIEFKINIIL